MNRLWLASIVVFMSIGPACKSSAPKPKPKQKPASEDQVFDPPNDDDDGNDTPPVDDCKKNSSSSNGDSNDEDSNDEGNDEDSGFDLAKFFGLQDTKVTYDSDIKSILAAKCISCHAGTTEPDISTYAAAKNAASKINSEVQAGKMPTSGPLNDNDKQKIQQWLTDGTLEKESSDSDSGNGGSDDSDNDNDSNDSSSSGSNCDNNDSSSSSDDDDDDDEGGDSGSEVADWEEFLNPEGLKDCKDKDKIFDRVKQECHKAKIASFTCDKSGVLAHFKKLGVTVDSTYESIIDDGFEIDQCGEYNDEPIVLFYKKNESSSELNLKIRKLCKKDSEACS